MNILKLTVITLFLLVSMGSQAEIISHPNIDPDILTEMILDSDVIHCTDNKCIYVQDGSPFNEPGNYPDNYMVIFPHGKYSVEEIEYYSKPIAEFYSKLLQLKPKI